MKRLLIGGALVAVVLAAVVSFYASSAPDGLNRVAEDHGIASVERDSAAAGSPLADYSVKGLSNDRLSNATAGLVGLAVTAAAGFGLLYIIKGRQN